MENQIVLTGNEAIKYQRLRDSIRTGVEDRGLSEELSPMIKTPYELFAKLHALQAYVRDVAMWLGALPGYSGVNIENAQKAIMNAHNSHATGGDASDWVFHLEVTAGIMEAVDWYSRKES